MSQYQHLATTITAAYLYHCVYTLCTTKPNWSPLLFGLWLLLLKSVFFRATIWPLQGQFQYYYLRAYKRSYFSLHRNVIVARYWCGPYSRPWNTIIGWICQVGVLPKPNSNSFPLVGLNNYAMVLNSLHCRWMTTDWVS